MKQVILLIVVVFLGALPLVGMDRHQSRHIEGIEFLVPLGTHSVGELFRSLSELNQGGPGKFPLVWDERKVTLRPGDRNRAFVISAEELLSKLDHQVKLFAKDYHVEVSRHSFALFRLGKYGKLLSDAESRELWKQELPRIHHQVTISADGEQKLRSGYYEKAVVIEGSARLEGGPAVFQDLTVKGSLEVKVGKVEGGSLSADGRVKLGEGTFMKFKQVRARGELRLEDGANLKAKKVIMGKKGRLIFGEDSNVIFD